MSALEVEAVDSTGAGDAFATGLLLALRSGYGYREVLEFASAVAAMKVMRLGSHEIPSLREVREFISMKKH